MVAATLLAPLPAGTPVTIDGEAYVVSHVDGDDVYLVADASPRGPWIFSRAQVDAGTVEVKSLWKFQHESGSVALGYATDARGLRLRAECGYTWVNMGDGWLQIAVAARKVALREQLAEMVR